MHFRHHGLLIFDLALRAFHSSWKHFSFRADDLRRLRSGSGLKGRNRRRRSRLISAAIAIMLLANFQ
jgi:hypothetical protein